MESRGQGISAGALLFTVFPDRADLTVNGNMFLMASLSKVT